MRLVMLGCIEVGAVGTFITEVGVLVLDDTTFNLNILCKNSGPDKPSLLVFVVIFTVHVPISIS